MGYGMPLRYEFGERLAMSHAESSNGDIGAILVGQIPGALSAHPAHLVNDRHGVDWYVEMPGRHLGVDCKVRSEDWSKRADPCDDIALEIWSVEEKGIRGWTADTDKRCDYILWLWKDTGRWMLVPFQMLLAVFVERLPEWEVRFKIARQFTPGNGGYHSVCIFVPRREVWAAIYHKFAGVPK
jgi:hypothetical protein